jgi:hypothetical protein
MDPACHPSISCPRNAPRRARSGSVGDDGALERRRLDSEVLKDPDLVLAQPTQRHVSPAVRQGMTEYRDSEVMEFAHLREIEVESFIRARWHEKSLETSGCEAIEDALQADHREGGSRVFESHEELRERAGKGPVSLDLHQWKSRAKRPHAELLYCATVVSGRRPRLPRAASITRAPLDLALDSHATNVAMRALARPAGRTRRTL